MKPMSQVPVRRTSAGRRHSRVLRQGAALAALAVLAAAVLAGPATAAVTAAAQAQPAAAAPRAASPTSRYAATITDGRATAEQLLAQSPGASLSLALVHHGRVVWQEGFGYADRATQSLPGPDTMYGIASVSKIVATVATMELVDAGKVDLDAPVTRYLPTFTMASPAYQEVTVRMLLDHSSGFPGSDYGNDETTVYNPGYLAQMMATLAQTRLKTTPGYMSVYCNDGFTLLEAVIASVTGESYAQYVQDEVLTPLGMTHTAFPLESFADGTWARAYDDDTAKPREVCDSLASGGTWSTPTDLGRLGTMLMDGGVYEGHRFLSREAVAAMGTDQTLRSFDPVPGWPLRFGLGWDTVTEPASHAAGVTAWAKNGGIIDYHSSFMVAPGAKLCVAVVATSPLSTDSCDALARRILVHALRDQGTIRRLPGPVATTAPPVRRATQAQLHAVEGVYARSDALFRVEPSAADPQELTLSTLSGGSWVPAFAGLRLRSDGRFHAAGSAAGFWSVPAGGRRYLAYSAPGDFDYYSAEFLFAQKLPPDEPLTAAWQARVGHTWLLVDALPTTIWLAADGGPALQVGEVPGAPGYATISTFDYSMQTVDASRSDTLGTMFLQIPGVGSRDMEDAVIEQHGAEEWVRWGSQLYRPEDTAPALAEGPNAVSFGPEGYAEWRTVTAASKVHIATGTAWFLYGPGLDYLGSGTTLPADATAPAGSHLLLYGPTGGSITLTVGAG